MFGPEVVLTRSEPTHTLLAAEFDNNPPIPPNMKQAFTGAFFCAKPGDMEFDHSPFLHIQTFRTTETYGDRVRSFKAGLLKRIEPH